WTGRDAPVSLAPPPGTETAGSTPTTLVASAFADEFVWPDLERGFTSVNELAGAFVDEQLGWTAFDLVGDIDDQQQPQSFTLHNGDLGVDVPVMAAPSPNGWGFVQVGAGGMSLELDWTADGSGPVLAFDPFADARTYSITAQLAHGGLITFESATAPVELPVEPNTGIATVLVLGKNADGLAVGASGGQFFVGDEEPLPPSSTAPATSAVDEPSASAEVGTPADSALADAMQVEGRVLVVNAAEVGGLAGSLSDALAESGYDVIDAENAADGTRLTESIIYTQPDMPNSMLPTSIANVLDIGRWETIGAQATPALTVEMIEAADLIIVLGDDLAGAPWQDRSGLLIDPGVGRLLILDATSTERGQAVVDDLARRLRADGVDVSGISESTTTFGDTMLMPVSEPSAWTYAVAELAGIGGFDTWTPSLIDGGLPGDVDAVLVVGEPD
ncbi:MAG: hypothetical protein CL424_06850, partial [Acidimicrobiaceae bacterium]|nr:hypothetical protein [Acidimicrobiaceae bacterium]